MEIRRIKEMTRICGEMDELLRITYMLTDPVVMISVGIYITNLGLSRCFARQYWFPTLFFSSSWIASVLIFYLYLVSLFPLYNFLFPWSFIFWENISFYIIAFFLTHKQMPWSTGSLSFMHPLLILSYYRKQLKLLCLALDASTFLNLHYAPIREAAQRDCWAPRYTEGGQLTLAGESCY